VVGVQSAHRSRADNCHAHGCVPFVLFVTLLFGKDAHLQYRIKDLAVQEVVQYFSVD